MLFLLHRFFTETNKHLQPKKARVLATLLPRFGKVFRHQVFTGCALVSGLMITQVLVFSTINPFLFEVDWHFGARAYGFLALLAVSGLMIGMQVNKRLVKRVDGLKLATLAVVGGLVVTTSSYILAILHDLPWQGHMVSIFALSFCCSFVMPNLGAKAMVIFRHIAGTAGAIYASIRSICIGVVSGLAVHFHVHSQAKLFLLLLLVNVLALAIIPFIRTQRAQAVQ